MKILMLNYEFPPVGGGAANANFYLLKEFAKSKNLQIDLITSSPDKFKQEKFSNNIIMYKLDVGKKQFHYWKILEIAKYTLKAFFLAKKLVKEKEYDLCHCWFGWPSGIIGFLLRKQVPYIVALRGSDVPGYNPRLKFLDKILFKPLSKIVWNNAKTVTAVSNDLKKLARNTSNKKIEVIYNGIDSKEFTPGRKKDFNVLFVGRLIERKGLIFLLEAFKNVLQKHSNIKLTIVGSGPQESELKKFCKQNNISKNVNFTGMVEHKNIHKIYSQSSVFVLPSIEEALANVTQEALASGLPVITTKTGAAELIHNNGFIVEKQNSKQIEKALLKYIENSALLQRHSNNSRKLAEKMSWQNVSKKYLQVYSQVKK